MTEYETFTAYERGAIRGAYVECALWASTDDNGDPLDGSRYGLAVETLEAMHADVDAFVSGVLENGGTFGGLEPAQIGHDFWLTRNRHGAGFWDRGLGELGDELTEAAHAHGEADLYVGDDGLIHQA